MTKRQQKQLLTSCFTLLIISVGWIVHRYNLVPAEVTPATPQDSQFHQVVSVQDGDTITVQLGDTTEKVRLIGVDTPEVKDPRKPVQCFGAQASQFTTSLIGTNTVRLESDPTNSDRDRYNRLLRYVYLPDGTLVNAAIIKQGYGFAYTAFPFAKETEFRQYQLEAEQQRSGLWGSCQTSQTTSGNQQTNSN